MLGMKAVPLQEGNAKSQLPSTQPQEGGTLMASAGSHDQQTGQLTQGRQTRELLPVAAMTQEVLPTLLTSLPLTLTFRQVNHELS